jgi:hypothetical protein
MALLKNRPVWTGAHVIEAAFPSSGLAVVFGCHNFSCERNDRQFSGPTYAFIPKTVIRMSIRVKVEKYG